MKSYSIPQKKFLGKKSETLKLNLHYIFLQIFYWLSTCAITGFVAYFLSAKGFGEANIGWMVAGQNILLIIVQPFVAQFADHSIRIRIKHMLIFFTLLAMSIAFVLHGLVPQHVLFTPMYLVLVVLLALNGGLLTTLSSEHIAKGTPIRFGLARGIGSISFASMSILNGLLVNRHGENVSLLLFISLSIFFVLGLATFPSPEKSLKNTNQKADSLISFIKGNPRFFIMVFTCFIALLFTNMVGVYFYKIVEEIGGNSASFGRAVAVAAYVELFSMAAYPYIKKILGSHANMIRLSTIAIFIKAFLLLNAKSLEAMYWAQALQFFGYGLYIPAQVYYVSTMITEQNIAKGQTFLGLAGTLALVCSSLLGGYFIEQFGIYPTIMVVGGISLVGLVLLFFCIEQDTNK